MTAAGGWRTAETMRRSLAREDNERIARAAGGGSAPYRCECGDPACTVPTVVLSAGEYEAVRAVVTRFLILPDHENPETDTVVHEHLRYAIVEVVTGEGRRAARLHDPRARPPGSTPRGFPQT